MEQKQKIIEIINNYSPELAAEEILLLFGVSHQRKLLEAFMSSKRVDKIHSLNEYGVRQEIEIFLKAFNCG